MDTLFLILLVLIFVQVFFISIKTKEIKYQQTLSEISELMDYIERGASSLTDGDGKNALMIACSTQLYVKDDEEGIVDLIKKAELLGFDLNLRCSKDGKTTLHYALIMSGNKAVVAELIRAGAEVNSKDATGRTTLFEAVKSNLSAYKLVVDRTEDVNHQDDYGVPPLMIAAYQMRIDIIEDLLERRADVKLRNKAGETTYDVAKKYMGQHIRISIESNREGEMGKASIITTQADILADQEHNHMVRECVRHLECLVKNEEYVLKKFKKPFFNTGKAK